MGLFDHFPYTNFHELNLDWILNALRELEHTIDQFVAINALKYADPIQWNIVSQYEKNTIVIDPLTGTAYISVQPVPSGVAITNTDYWTVVFDLGSFVVRAARNFTDKFEEETTLTATFPSNVNDWLIWGDVLYRVISPIVAGDQYVIGSNIEHFTAEDIIGHIEELDTTDKSNLVAAINELVQALIDEAQRVDDITGDLADLSTTDKSNLVAAINEIFNVLADLISDVGDIADLQTIDQSTIVNAINEIVNNIGDKADLQTADKTSIVNAINEVFNDIIYVTPQMYGAVADGVTDDTQAFNDALAAGAVYVPEGVYFIDGNITVNGNKTLKGIYASDNSGTKLLLSSTGSIVVTGNNNVIEGLYIDAVDNKLATAILFDTGSSRNNRLSNLGIRKMDYAIKSIGTLWCNTFENIYINGCAHGFVNTGLALICNFNQVYFSYCYNLIDMQLAENCAFLNCNFGLIRAGSVLLSNKSRVLFESCNFECDIELETAGAIFQLTNWYTIFNNCSFKINGTSANYGIDCTTQVKGIVIRECTLEITAGTMPKAQFWGSLVPGLNGGIILERSFNFPPYSSNSVFAGLYDIYETDSIAFGDTEAEFTTITIPALSHYCITAALNYSNSRPKSIKMVASDNSITAANNGNETGTGNNNGIAVTISGYAATDITISVRGSYYVSDTNRYYVSGFYTIGTKTFIA